METFHRSTCASSTSESKGITGDPDRRPIKSGPSRAGYAGGITAAHPPMAPVFDAPRAAAGATH